MKTKFFSSFLIIALLISLLSVNGFANDAATPVPLEKLPTGVMFFSDDSAHTYYSPISTRQVIDGILNVYFEVDTKDPKFAINAKGELLELELSESPVLVLKVKFSRPITEEEGYSQIFFYTTDHGEVTAEQRSIKFNPQATTDWHLIVVDLNDNTFFADGAYGGELKYIRYDPCLKVLGEELTIEVDWMAAFESKEALEGFDGDMKALLATPIPDPTEIPEQTPTREPTATPEATKVPVNATRAPVTQAPAEKESSGCGAGVGLAQVLLVLGATLVIKRKK